MLWLLFFFFFFKRKTAYGIKECDWSSDVCSSDLRKNSYVLMRQEGTRRLAFDAYTRDAEGDLRSYVMIDGIQRLEVQYGIVEQKTAGDEKKTVKRVYKKQKSWDSKPKQDEKQKTNPNFFNPIFSLCRCFSFRLFFLNFSLSIIFSLL